MAVATSPGLNKLIWVDAILLDFQKLAIRLTMYDFFEKKCILSELIDHFFLVRVLSDRPHPAFIIS